MDRAGGVLHQKVNKGPHSPTYACTTPTVDAGDGHAPGPAAPRASAVPPGRGGTLAGRKKRYTYSHRNAQHSRIQHTHTRGTRVVNQMSYFRVFTKVYPPGGNSQRQV